MTKRPEKKELKVCGHALCPECVRVGHDQACDEWEAFLKGKKCKHCGKAIDILS